MKTVIYIRTSTEEQNPENQLSDCKTLTDEPYEVVKEKQSAFKDKERPKFEMIKSRIKKGEIKDLICWDWDRLFRNRVKLKEFFVFCKLYKCNIHSYRQKFFEEFYKIPEPFNEIMQELFIGLLGWMGEDESKKKSERVKIAHRNHKGKKWGRPKVHTNKIKVILDLRSQGLSIREISKKANLSTGKISEILRSYKQTPVQEGKTPIQNQVSKVSINEQK